MRRKLVASGILLFVLGFLVTLVPKQIEAYIKFSFYPVIGIFVGVAGMVLLVIGLLTALAGRL